MFLEQDIYLILPYINSLAFKNFIGSVYSYIYKQKGWVTSSTNINYIP